MLSRLIQHITSIFVFSFFFLFFFFSLKRCPRDVKREGNEIFTGNVTTITQVYLESTNVSAYLGCQCNNIETIICLQNSGNTTISAYHVHISEIGSVALQTEGALLVFSPIFCFLVKFVYRQRIALV
ncbi:hypothetical protein O6U65_1516 [Saccharomyces cerevisiae synthetic construct]|uniref:Putative uncharacterized protein YLL037W n=1 Tax=Saccharomyces cerevisiae (strain ATCC 204508 / S288c) TaxID=559292 RepID=YL037_YEAST|nr:RecName: Full=Putative uncharacterized protein YLL037W [Saccharomyces cerevisiae S288C]WNV72659.1 hypothetical protein O6U65_1516 [Saccharomyces cerevisiae synthetic construct]CAA97486.1 unnamed protein product [Saccharomyces cerevisiae]